jgi:hypothetical protein
MPAWPPSVRGKLGLAARWLGLRIRRFLPLALALVLGSAWPAFGQVEPGKGQLAVRSDGFVFWIQEGQRHVVFPAALSDEAINAMPESVPLNSSLLPLDAAVAPGALPPGGASRADRLWFGQTCVCSVVRGPGQRGEVQIRLVSTHFDAWPLLRTTNPTNQFPKEGFEYIMVTLNIKYAGGSRDLPLSLDRFDFSLVDSNDAHYTPAFVIEPNALISVTAYPGTDVTGEIAFQIPRDDPDPVLVWRYNDESPTWFAIQ